MRISARADYALRAMIELASAEAGALVKADRVAEAQAIPGKFLESILRDLGRSGLVESRRGASGGHRLARPAAAVTVADVIRAVDGPLASIHGARPEDVEYAGGSARLRDVWIALRTSIRDVLESVTLADLVSGPMPETIVAFTSRPEAWESRIS